MAVSVQEFAAKIKAKYPEYQHLDDASLAVKVVNKYPEYKEKVNWASASQATFAQGKPIDQVMKDAKPLQQPSNMGSALGGLLGGGLLGGQNKSTPVGNFIQNKALPQIQDSLSREGLAPSQFKKMRDPLTGWKDPNAQTGDNAYNVGKQAVEGIGNTLAGVGKVAYAPLSPLNPLDTRTMEQKSETGIEGLNQIIGGVGQTVTSPLAASPTAQTLVSLPFEALHDTLSGAFTKMGVDTESQHGKNIVDSALNGILLAVGAKDQIINGVKSGKLTPKDAWEQVKQTGDMAKEIPYMAKDAMKGGKASWVDKNVISPIAAEAGKMSPETTRMAMENPKLLTAAQKEGVMANRAKTFEMAKAPLDEKIGVLEKEFEMNKQRTFEQAKGALDAELQNLEHTGKGYEPIRQSQAKVKLTEESPSIKVADQQSIKNEFLNADEVNMSDAQLLQKMKEYEQRTKRSSYTVEGKKYKKTNSDLMADEKGRARIAAYFDEVGRPKTSTGTNPSSNWVENFFQKKGLKIENGKIIANSESAIRSPGEIARVQHLYDTYAKNPELASGGFLNLRKDVGGLSKFGEGITTDMTSFAKDFYNEINAKGRPQIKGLKELDEKYSPLKKNLQDAKKLIYDKEGMVKPDAYESVTKAIAQGKPGVVEALKKVIPEFEKFMEEAQKNTAVKSELKQFKQLIYDTDGNIKPNAISEINNLFNKGKEGKLERMKEIMPDFEEFQKQVKITKALEDIEASKTSRTGFYRRAANAPSAVLGYAMGNVPGAIIGIVLHNIMTNPAVILETLKKYGEVKISTARLIKDIGETVNSGKKLTPAQTKFLIESASLYQKEKE